MSGVNYNWNIDEVYKLIESFKERELLWNTSLEEYKHRDKKREAWCEIGKVFNMDKLTIERKVRSLVGQFHRELKKHGANGRSKWFAYKRMMFLNNRHSVDLWPTPDAESKNSLNTPECDSRSNDVNMIRKRMIAKRQQSLFRSKQSYNTSQNDSEKLRRPLSKYDEEDEFDAFARNVALQLKQLPLIHALKSQELIQRILREQRIKALRNSAENQNVVVLNQGTRDDSNDNAYDATLEERALDSQQDPLTYCNVLDSGTSVITKSEPPDHPIQYS